MLDWTARLLPVTEEEVLVVVAPEEEVQDVLHAGVLLLPVALLLLVDVLLPHAVLLVHLLLLQHVAPVHHPHVLDPPPLLVCIANLSRSIVANYGLDGSPKRSRSPSPKND